jgi:diguanylate cyclase (GGDEF)-like protein
MAGMRAFDVDEERRLAGLTAGLLYLTAAVTVLAMIAMPGITRAHWHVVVAIAAIAAVWGTACLTVIPWERVHPLVSHFSCGMGFPLTAFGVAATGGAESPAFLYLLFIVAYVAYFYPTREAVPHLVGCIVVTVFPLFYDNRAINDGFLAEVLIICPTYILLGGFIHAGKRQLVELSRHDALTGLCNRRALTEIIERRVGARRDTTLLMVDLDGFKGVNTRFGHPVGDAVLCSAAQALQRAAGQGDIVARLGGDEFAIVLPSSDVRAAEATAERVLHEVREACLGMELPGLGVTASVGYAAFPDRDTVVELMAGADIALRESKVAGKDRATGTAPVSL